MKGGLCCLQNRESEAILSGSECRICTACCGTGREETIDCAISCQYLADAHQHEKKPVEIRS